jgi:hypothetical protein
MGVPQTLLECTSHNDGYGVDVDNCTFHFRGLVGASHAFTAS